MTTVGCRVCSVERAKARDRIAQLKRQRDTGRVMAIEILRRTIERLAVAQRDPIGMSDRVARLLSELRAVLAMLGEDEEEKCSG